MGIGNRRMVSVYLFLCEPGAFLTPLLHKTVNLLPTVAYGPAEPWCLLASCWPSRGGVSGVDARVVVQQIMDRWA